LKKVILNPRNKQAQGRLTNTLTHLSIITTKKKILQESECSAHFSDTTTDNFIGGKNIRLELYHRVQKKKENNR
jgi:hypothetical protein